MKIVLTIDVPGGTEEGLVEELQLDISDAIACGEEGGVAGRRCHPDYPVGTWNVEFIK